MSWVILKLRSLFTIIQKLLGIASPGEFGMRITGLAERGYVPFYHDSNFDRLNARPSKLGYRIWLTERRHSHESGDPGFSCCWLSPVG